VATIKPFRALRPKTDIAKQISCVPYDVVYTSEVREFIDANQLSFLRVTRAEAEFPEGLEATPEEIFGRAKQNLERFIDDEFLTQEKEPSIYIYQLSVEHLTQTGVVACCSIDEYENNIIKKHEKTRPDKVADRTEHMVTLKAQTGLIFLAFRNTETIHNLIENLTKEKPLYRFHCADGVKQVVWRDTDTEKWIKAFEEVPSLYIADGHHRAESSSLARKQLRDENPNHTGEEDYNYVIAGMYPAEDLQILAYNRVVKDLNGLSESELLTKLSERFEVTDTHEKAPHNPKEFCMYIDGIWKHLKFKGTFDEDADPLDLLDVNILYQNILDPVLGIGDQRTDNRIGFVGGARGTQELEKLVDEGIAKIAFSLYPTTMDDLFNVSDKDEIMPPKSTWFEPKLKDGLLVHLI
jgi:uncharacterized protein (DUF1015 family)